MEDTMENLIFTATARPRECASNINVIHPRVLFAPISLYIFYIEQQLFQSFFNTAVILTSAPIVNLFWFLRKNSYVILGGFPFFFVIVFVMFLFLFLPFTFFTLNLFLCSILIFFLVSCPLQNILISMFY